MSHNWSLTKAKADLEHNISDTCCATLNGVDTFRFIIITASSGTPTYFTSIFSSLGILFSCLLRSSSNKLLLFCLIYKKDSLLNEEDKVKNNKAILFIKTFICRESSIYQLQFWSFQTPTEKVGTVNQETIHYQYQVAHVKLRNYNRTFKFLVFFLPQK